MTGKYISITDNQLIGSETEDWVKVKKCTMKGWMWKE